MEKYASCSKIREDTRVPKGGRQVILKAKRIRVFEREIVFALTAPESRLGHILRGSNEDRRLDDAGVCLEQIFLKDHGKNSRFFPFCPLILVTKGDTMINNMVLSREIEWIGYEHKRNMLQVEFIVGAIYQYENVPEMVYQEFLTAPSHGRFFESNIKNKYQTRKIR